MRHVLTNNTYILQYISSSTLQQILYKLLSLLDKVTSIPGMYLNRKLHNTSIKTTTMLVVFTTNTTSQLGVPFFMEIIILMSLSIWTARNGFIFNGVAPSIITCKLLFRNNFAMLMHRAKKYFSLIEQWLQALL